MKRRTAMLLGMVAAAVAVCVGVSGFSAATFVTSTTSTVTVRGAADWAPPTVTMTTPGSSVTGTVTLEAVASDAGGSGVASVEIQRQLVGSDAGWVTVCTDTTSPYSCSWSTTAVADGQYDLRARATDNAAYTVLSDSVRTVVANSVVVVLGDPGDAVRGLVPLTTTVHGGLALSWTVTVQYATSGSSTWSTACSAVIPIAASSATCTWDTTGRANGSYDLRAVARPLAGSAYTSAVVADVPVDNTPPTVTMTDPGSPLRGTVTLSASAGAQDPARESGVGQVTIQVAAGSTGAFQTVCTLTAPPYSCRYDTTKVTDGSYRFRAVAIDVAGNSATSAEVLGRIVDNTVSSVSVEDPGTFLSGTVAVSASASSTAGIGSVRIQAARSGTSTWSDVCTDTAAPYSCGWSTTTVADGLYDLRAVLTDGAGRQTTSAVVVARRVDNSPLRGVDVQAGNGGGTVGRLDDGDTVTLTYSRAISPSTVTTGWAGGSLPVTVRLRDGNVPALGTGSKGDTLDVQRDGGTVNLGAVDLREDFAKSGKTVTFNATMTATTTTVEGVDRTVVTLRLGTRASGTTTSLRTVTLPAAMVWTPSSAVTTLDGRACSTAPATETGASDRDL